VRVEIFDAGGRRVRVLRDGPLPAGRHEAAWNGRDGKGAAVAAGVYFYALSVDDQKIARKIVYLD
jgi:flagellar hook assembly protein FlgD